MCLSIPGQVKEINKKSFVIQYNQQEVKVPNSIIKDIEEGDWVIVQNKCITQKLTPQQAKDFFKIVNS
jgi:hydrogenase maturation factor